MESGPYFSIIIPVRDRVEDGKLQRCLSSVISQTYPTFEAIIVDDGSEEDVRGLIVSFYEHRFRYLRTEPQGRVIARNLGMQAALGEWIAWLDSDDALDSEYLNTFRYNIISKPEVKVWVCGAVVHGMLKEADQQICPQWTQIRSAWIPPLNPEGPGHAHFTSGKVGTGMFVFSRECLEKTGLMPPWKTVYDVADGINVWLGYDTGYSAAKKWVGNPWGDDHCMFRRLTQFFKVELINAALYIQYVR